MQGHVINAENSENHDFGYTCYLPSEVEIDGLYVHRLGKCYLFSKVNPKHNSDSYEASSPVVTPDEVTVKDFDSLVYGKLLVSKNEAMFDVEISQ